MSILKKPLKGFLKCTKSFKHLCLQDEESIRKSMKYSDVVINCIGREYETRNFKFKDVNVTGPATLARIAKEMGVKRFIHISSINASDNPQVCIFSHYKIKIEFRNDFLDGYN